MKKTRFLTLVLGVFMTLALVVPVGAITIEDSSTNPIIVTDKVLSIPKTAQDTVQPFGWGGPAPQITRIQLWDYGWLESNGNFGIMLKVHGYGHSIVSEFNGAAIAKPANVGHFIDFGNTADGFFYLYDCGPVTEAGTYDFYTLFKSTNSPQSQLAYRNSFTFS